MMVYLYTTEEAEKLKRKADGMRAAALVTGGAALAVCIVLCCLVTTANAPVMQALVTGLSILAGWGVMLLYTFGIRQARAEADHMLGILKSEPEEHRGILTVTDQAFHIPRSITVYKATLEENGEKLSLNINARLAGRLPALRGPVKVKCVRRYVIAVGEGGEAA